jgi:hypothetical protein
MRFKEFLENGGDVDSFKKAADKRKDQTGKNFLVLRRKTSNDHKIIEDNIYAKWSLAQQDPYIVVYQTNKDLTESEKREHLKNWVAKQLWYDYTHDPIMPAKERDVESMELDDQDLFHKTVNQAVEHIKKSKLPLEAAYEDFLKSLEMQAKKVMYKHYH